MGRSVVDAIAEYAGKPVRLLEDGEVTHRHTFVSTRKYTIAPPVAVPLPRLRFSLIDVPDLQLLSVGNVPIDRIWFGVATRPAIYHAMLRLLARLVRFRLIPSIKPLAGLMHFTMNRLSWGEHRGGMFIELRGKDHDNKPLVRSWHLVAEGDIGPNVPTLAANVIIRSWLAGKSPPPGARSADGALALSDLQPQFESLGIATGERTVRRDDDRTLFHRCLDSGWRALPNVIRDLHRNSGTFAGFASVDRGASHRAHRRVSAGRIRHSGCRSHRGGEGKRTLVSGFRWSPVFQYVFGRQAAIRATDVRTLRPGQGRDGAGAAGWRAAIRHSPLVIPGHTDAGFSAAER